MFVPCENCVLSGRGLCDGLIIVVCLRGSDYEALVMRRLWHTKGCCAIEKNCKFTKLCL